MPPATTACLVNGSCVSHHHPQQHWHQTSHVFTFIQVQMALVRVHRMGRRTAWELAVTHSATPWLHRIISLESVLGNYYYYSTVSITDLRGLQPFRSSSSVCWNIHIVIGWWWWHRLEQHHHRLVFLTLFYPDGPLAVPPRCECPCENW